MVLAGVRQNRGRVLIGLDARVLDLIARVTGAGYQRLFVLVTGRLVPPAH